MTAAATPVRRAPKKTGVQAAFSPSCNHRNASARRRPGDEQPERAETDLVPGSLVYAFGVVLVVLFNILILDRLLEEKSSTYGSLGMAATLLLGFFLIGRVIVGAAVLNAPLHDRHRRTHDDEVSEPSLKQVPQHAAEPTDMPTLR
jgi:hypothetical protein